MHLDPDGIAFATLMRAPRRAEPENLASPYSQSLGQLLEASAVKKAYRKALLAVHPDKQDSGNVE